MIITGVQILFNDHNLKVTTMMQPCIALTINSTLKVQNSTQLQSQPL